MEYNKFIIHCRNKNILPFRIPYYNIVENEKPSSLERKELREYTYIVYEDGEFASLFTHYVENKIIPIFKINELPYVEAPTVPSAQHAISDESIFYFITNDNARIMLNKVENYEGSYRSIVLYIKEDNIIEQIDFYKDMMYKMKDGCRKAFFIITNDKICLTSLTMLPYYYNIKYGQGSFEDAVYSVGSNMMHPDIGDKQKF